MTNGYYFSLHSFPALRPTHAMEIVATHGLVLGTLQKACLVKMTDWPRMQHTGRGECGPPSCAGLAALQTQPDL